MTFHEFIYFWRNSFRLMIRGSTAYWAWIGFLLFLIAIGGYAYLHQLKHGLIVSAMRDQVMWGLYIGNFTFLVGVAAAAIVLVIPAYIYDWGPIKEIVIIGELLAISAVIMCLLFVAIDIGRPDRFWHLIPLVGILSLPSSLLAWDVVVLNGYLLLNIVIVTHIIYRSFHGREPSKTFVIPLVIFSIPLAVSIHTVTAFLYNGIPARPFWNASILAPRFLASAFCSGPAIILLLLQILRKAFGLNIKDAAIWKIAELMAYAMAMNLFFLISEIFKEYYSDTHHLLHTQYLYFGLGELNPIVGYAWLSVAMGLIAFFLFVIPATRKNPFTLNLGCLLIYFGVYIEKGIGLVIPGLTPDTLGEIYGYHPTMVEFAVTAAVFSVGFLVFTLMVKVAIPIALGNLLYKPKPVQG